MISYGKTHLIVKFNDTALNLVRRSIQQSNLEWKQSELENKKDTTVRISEQAWINNWELNQQLIRIVKSVNRDAGWFLNIHDVEPVQFGVYPEGGKYDWHLDQHPKFMSDRNGNPVIRKISMSLFYSDLSEYGGGELDLEIYKPGTEPRYESFRLEKGSAIFFQSDQWHRVRPVTSGVRKSIVAWFVGPPYV